METNYGEILITLLMLLPYIDDKESKSANKKLENYNNCYGMIMLKRFQLIF